MRCTCCNRLLNDYEATIKSVSSGEYLDTCMKCLDGLEIQYLASEDLEPTDPNEDDCINYEEDE